MAERTMEGFIQAVYAIKAEWEAMLTNPRLKFQAEAEWAIQSFTKNDYAVKATLGDTEAAMNAVRNIAAIGITLDPARKFAYILPRDRKMVLDVSYQGLMDIAISSGSIQWAQAYRVYEKDRFELAGYDAPPVHRRDPFSKDRGNVIGCYVVVKTVQGDYLTATMHIDEIHAIRARSSSYKAYLADNKKLCPWNTDAEKMELKTVVKNAYAYWPRSDRLDQAIHYLNTDGGQGIDLAGDDSGIKAVLENLQTQIKACKDGAAVAAIWTNGRASLKEHPEAYEQFRASIAARNKELGVQPPPPKAAPGASSDQKPTPDKAPGPKPGSQAAILDLIRAAETDAELEATGLMIDALPVDQQQTCNDHYNERLAYLNLKFNRAG